MTRITKEWRIQIGTNPDGSAQYRAIGYELEDDFGGGNKTTRLHLPFCPSCWTGDKHPLGGFQADE